MELLQLQYFITAARYEHMTKAAAALHIAQPALSQSIKRLEAELGVKLFLRSGRNIKLSPEGKVLQGEAASIIESMEKLPFIVGDAADLASRTININVLSASDILTDLIIEYKELHPEVLFQLSQNAGVSNWDIKVSSITPSVREESNHIALKEEIFIAVPASSVYSSFKSVELSQLKDASFICLDSTRPFTAICNNYCYSAGFVPNAAFESDSPATVRKLIEAGLGVSFWPAYSWGAQTSPKVKLLPIDRPKCTRQIYIAENKKSSSLMKNDFYQFIVARFQSF